jgi:hypothetical protein
MPEATTATTSTTGPTTSTVTSTGASPRPGPGGSAAKAAQLSAVIYEEILASVKRAQQFALDAVTTWADVVGKVAPELPVAPFVPARSDVVEGLGAMFDVADELLAAQRKFASDLAKVLVPAS